MRAVAHTHQSLVAQSNMFPLASPDRSPAILMVIASDRVAIAIAIGIEVGIPPLSPVPISVWIPIATVIMSIADTNQEGDAPVA